MNVSKIFTKITLMVAITGILAPFADASSFSRMVRRKTDAINGAISSLQQRVSEVGVTTVMAEFQGVYAPVGRQNDIFVFCEKGMGEMPENHFWISVNPLSGQFQITNWYYVNYTYIPYFVVLCPYGRRLGQWQGPGEGSQFKANRSYDSRTSLEKPVPIGVPITPFLH